MINISKYTKLLFLCLSSIIVFTSCEDDETVFDRIVGHEWVGDLGFADRYGPLESGLFFERNGFGSDAQCYYDDPHGDIIYELPFRWVINGGILSLDYGNDYPLLEIYDVYVFGDELSGVLYVDGRQDGPITLYRY